MNDIYTHIFSYVSTEGYVGLRGKGGVYVAQRPLICIHPFAYPILEKLQFGLLGVLPSQVFGSRSKESASAGEKFCACLR